jgi:acetyl esterase/lipase
MSPRILARSLLAAISIVVAILPLLVALGAFFPMLPTVGRFGTLVGTHLPALLVEASIAAAIAVLAMPLGGGRAARLIVALNTAVTGALLFIVLVTMVFASQLGVSFDIFQMARAPQLPPAADVTLRFASIDGIDLHAQVWRARRGDTYAADGKAGSPAVVYVHGGAFISGHMGSRPTLFDALAAAGIAVVDIEYRLASPPRWADAPADVLCALGWVEAHAVELGVDPSKIVIAGESAGGSLAMLAGYAAGTDLLASSCGGTAVEPRGVFAVAPAADLAGIWADRSIYALDRPFPEAYVGGSPSEVPERYEMASPFRLLRADLPPTYLLTGANDHFVYVDRVVGLHEQLLAAGAPSRLVVAPFVDHGFDGFPNGFGAQVEEVLLPRFVAEVTR